MSSDEDEDGDGDGRKRKRQIEDTGYTLQDFFNHLDENDWFVKKVVETLIKVSLEQKSGMDHASCKPRAIQEEFYFKNEEISWKMEQ